jgi:hypothetical protein
MTRIGAIKSINDESDGGIDFRSTENDSRQDYTRQNHGSHCVGTS